MSCDVNGSVTVKKESEELAKKLLKDMCMEDLETNETPMGDIELSFSSSNALESEVNNMLSELGDSVVDYEIYFENDWYGEKWRITPNGIEREQTYYKTDTVKNLMDNGYSKDEAEKIVSLIV